jgi:hypothetical protein
MVHCTLYLEFQSSLFFFFTVYILLGTLSLSRLFVTLCTTRVPVPRHPFALCKKVVHMYVHVYHLYFNF